MFHHLFVIMSYSILIVVEPPNNSHNSFGISPVAALQVSLERFQPSREFVKPLALDKTWKYS